MTCGVCVCVYELRSNGLALRVIERERMIEENWGNKNRPFGNIYLRERLSHTNIERMNTLRLSIHKRLVITTK